MAKRLPRFKADVLDDAAGANVKLLASYPYVSSLLWVTNATMITRVVSCCLELKLSVGPTEISAKGGAVKIGVSRGRNFAMPVRRSTPGWRVARRKGRFGRVYRTRCLPAAIMARAFH